MAARDEFLDFFAYDIVPKWYLFEQESDERGELLLLRRFQHRWV